MRPGAVLVCLAACLANCNGQCVGLSPSIPNDWCDLNCNYDPPFCPESACSCGGAGASPTPTPGAVVSCTGTAPATNEWCNQVCNHVVPFCPSLCSCRTSGGVTTTGPERLVCTTIQVPATNQWCSDNCNNEPPFCPADFCSCAASANTQPQLAFRSTCATHSNALCTSMCQRNPEGCPSDCCHATTAAVVAYRSVCPTFSDALCTQRCGSGQVCSEPCCIPVPGFPIQASSACCAGSTNQYATQHGDLVTVDSVTGDIRLCADFNSANNLAGDTAGGVYVADYGAGLVGYVPFGCGPIQVVTQWEPSRLIASPTALLIFNDGLFVADSGLQKIWFVTVREDKKLASLVDIGATVQLVVDMAVDTTISPAGVLYMIEGQSITTFDLATKVKGTYLSSTLPGLSHVEISPCGLFYTVNSKVFFCPDVTNSASCVRYCLDNPVTPSSCLLPSPAGVSIGCGCNLLVGSFDFHCT